MFDSKKIKLFCIPHAGASSSMYLKWEEFLYSQVELRQVELAGRGKRFKEKLLTNFSDVITDCCNIILRDMKDVNPLPYAIYGHSLGGLIAFGVCNSIQENKLTQPIHLFISGCTPPGRIDPKDNLDNLSNSEFIKEIASYGGIPLNLLQDPKMLNLFLPILRADFNVFFSHTLRDLKHKVNTDVTILYGNEDIGISKIDEWKAYVCKECDIQIFKGDHFFTMENNEGIINLINCKLARYYT
jgi:medium-chain acyl-[acyl-carrier-protein] hydrolase